MTEPPAAALMRMITGGWVAQAVSVVAELGVVDVLAADGPCSSEDLAVRVGADGAALHRVLRALATAGLFRRDGEGRFTATALAEPLRADVPGSQRAFAIMMGRPEVWRSWGDLLHTVRTGETAFDHLYGVPVFDHYRRDAEAARIGAAGLSSRSAVENEAVAAACDVAGTELVTDVGGGEGSLLRILLRAHPGLRGRLVDLPHVVELARAAAEGSAEAARLEFVPGDFFAEVPGGSGIVLLKKVIHDWDDERAGAILRNLAPARVLIMDAVVPTGNEPDEIKWFDLLMLVLLRGKERTEEEWRSLLAENGFRLVAVHDGPILEAAPA